MSITDKIDMTVGKGVRLVGKIGTALTGAGIVAYGLTQTKSALEALVTVAVGVGVAGLGYLTFDKGSSGGIDYSQPVFFSEQFRQKNYDREIDEGCSSGMKRYATLDVSGLAEDETERLIRGIAKEAKDFDLCKLVQVAGFNHEHKRYITVSGECHYGFVGSTKEMMTDRIKKVVGNRDIRFVQEHIPMPAQVPKYEPVDLCPYGSTGAPMQGIPMHADAAGLRRKGEIRE